MITIPQLTAQALGSFLARETESRFRSSHSDLTKLLPFAARLALECIGNSDALYRGVRHVCFVRSNKRLWRDLGQMRAVIGAVTGRD
jgi:hypothetical protein